MPHSAHHKHINKIKKTAFLSKLVLVIAVVEPLMTLPQVYEIWIRHQTAGVSLTTWIFFTLSAATWLLYGFSIKNTPLIVSGSLWILLEGSVVLGLLIY